MKLTEKQKIYVDEAVRLFGKDLVVDTFDKLIKQGRRSRSGSICLYRLNEKASCKVRCFIGWMIPDDKYKGETDPNEMMELLFHVGAITEPQWDELAETGLDKEGSMCLFEEIQSELHDSLKVKPVLTWKAMKSYIESKK